MKTDAREEDALPPYEDEWGIVYQDVAYFVAGIPDPSDETNTIIEGWRQNGYDRKDCKAFRQVVNRELTPAYRERHRSRVGQDISFLAVAHTRKVGRARVAKAFSDAVDDAMFRAFIAV